MAISEIKTNTPDEMISRILSISNSIRHLSLTESSDNSFEAKRFKRKQLESLLIGSQLSIDSDVDDELASSFLQMPDSGDHSHIAITNVKNIGCDFESITMESEVSVLDAHKKENSICDSCSNSKSKQPDFTKGIVNGFSCWRRGQTSRIFGFVSEYKLTTKGNEKTFLEHKKTYTSKEINSLFFGNESLDAKIIIGREQIRNSMMIMIHINQNDNVESSKVSEIKGLLTQQMLVSKSISVLTEDVKTSHRDHNDQIPEFIQTILEKTQHAWYLEGPSRNSRGIIGLALINNEDKYSNNSVFNNVLQTFAIKNHVWFGKYDLSSMNPSMNQNLGVSKMPSKSSVLCILLDTIVDLAGGDALEI